ncbi:MAG: hypothetical protein KDD76_01865 [Rickettsiales bacterium]|nr:hypothetical protein [Rickettsiales bacterium]
MSENRYSLQIAEGVQARSKDDPNRLEQNNNHIAISPEAAEKEKAAIAYYQANKDTLWQCMDAVQQIVDGITGSYKPHNVMGVDLHTTIAINKADTAQGNAPHITVRFYDYQTKGNTELTGACVGYMQGLCAGSRTRHAPQVHWSDGYSSRTSITFNSLQDLVMSLNARTHSQSEKIWMDGVAPQPRAIG